MAAERQARARRTPGDAGRLLDSVVDVVAAAGYTRTTVGQIAARAGISRAAFYQHYAGKEDAVVAAHQWRAAALCTEVGDAVAGAEAHVCARAAVAALARHASRERAGFTFLVREAMLAGPRGQAERDSLVDRLQQEVERRWQHAGDDEPPLDVPFKLLLEGTLRLLGLQIRREGVLPEQAVPELLRWVECYRRPARSEPRWRELVPEPALIDAGARRARVPVAPRPLPKGKVRLAGEVMRSIQRERILYATAETIRAKGLNDATVTDIVLESGLSRDLFYAHFRDKQEAFEETVKLVFEELLGALAGSYFYSDGARGWCDQIWEVGQRFAGFLEDNGALANCISAAANAPLPFLQRVDDFVEAFTIFIDGGFHCGGEAEHVPPIASEALVCAVLEGVTFYVRHGRVAELRGLVPAFVYTVIAPFVGTEQATRFVRGKARAAAAHGRPARRLIGVAPA
jgi:AcrR family transcriptional regulator